MMLIIAIVGLGAMFFVLAAVREHASDGNAVSSGSGTAVPTTAPAIYTQIAANPDPANSFAFQNDFTPPPAYTPAISSTSTINTAAEAISLTLETKFPSGFSPTLIEVRLVSYDTLKLQFLGFDPGSFVSDVGPIWLVGITANGMTNDNILPRGEFPGVTMAPPQAVPGAYYAWDANAAFVTAWGALTNSGAKSMAALQLLANETLAIATATDVPTPPPPTPTP